MLPPLGHREYYFIVALDLSPELSSVQSRAQSESSGEFSLSLENEPWSNGSSPVPQPPSCSSSSCQPPSDTSTPQHTLKLQQQQKETAATVSNNSTQTCDILPKQKDAGLSQDFWLTRGTKSIQRRSRGKVTRCSSDSGDPGKMNTGPSGMNSNSSRSKAEAETIRATVVSPVTVLCVRGKSSSMSGCLNCFSSPHGKEGLLKRPRSPKALPRASSVISTAEGSRRRSSVNSDCRATPRTDPPGVRLSEKSNAEETASQQQPGPDISQSEPEPTPPVKPPRDPALIAPSDFPTSPVQESLFDSSFAFNSVFSNTIFCDSAAPTTTSMDALGDSRTFFCLNEGPVGQEAARNTPRTRLSVEDGQSQYAEQSAGLQKDKMLTMA